MKNLSVQATAEILRCAQNDKVHPNRELLNLRSWRSVPEQHFEKRKKVDTCLRASSLS